VVLWKVARKERAEERRAEAELEGPKVRQLSKKEQDDAKKDKQVLSALPALHTRLGPVAHTL
jgi:hypothetical protein